MIYNTNLQSAHVRQLMHLFVLLLVVPLLVKAADNSNKKPGGENKPLWDATWTDRLKRDLMLSYDKFARPDQHTNTTVVTFGLTLKYIDIDEMNFAMIVNAWVQMAWVDDKLKWNSTDYGGLTRLYLADHEVWQPDIILFNSAAGSEVDHYGNTHCIVHDSGSVLWTPPAQFRAFCDIDLRRWPYDEQTCTLQLGSWTHDGDQIDLQVEYDGPGFEWSENNSEWELIDMTQKRNFKVYPCCPEPYIDVTYTLTLRRNSPTYTALIVTPSLVIVLLILAGFWLPPQAGEKVALNAFTALITLILLVSFSIKLPAMTSHTPLIVIFYSSCLVLVTFALVLSVIDINLARYSRRSPLPWVIRQILTGWLGRLLCLNITSFHHTTLGSVSGGGGEELRESGEDTAGTTEDRLHIIFGGMSSSSAQLDWLLLATAIDRLAFSLYCIIFLILGAICF